MNNTVIIIILNCSNIILINHQEIIISNFIHVLSFLSRTRESDVLKKVCCKKVGIVTNLPSISVPYMEILNLFSFLHLLKL